MLVCFKFACDRSTVVAYIICVYVDFDTFAPFKFLLLLPAFSVFLCVTMVLLKSISLVLSVLLLLGEFPYLQFQTLNVSAINLYRCVYWDFVHLATFLDTCPIPT
jgi:hypothetical protein